MIRKSTLLVRGKGSEPLGSAKQLLLKPNESDPEGELKSLKEKRNRYDYDL